MTIRIILLIEEDLFLREQINFCMTAMGDNEDDRKQRYKIEFAVLKQQLQEEQGRPSDAVGHPRKLDQFWYGFGGGLWILIQERPVRRTLFERTQTFAVIWLQREGPRRS